MPSTTFTILDSGEPIAVDANLAGGAIRIAPDSLASGLGWELKPQGFCKDDLCYPAPKDSNIAGAEGIDLAAFAALIGRPLATDLVEGAAFLGVGGATRANQLASLQAPDFTLPDLAGTMHTLSDYRGKKVLLAAYGSW